LGGFDGVVGRHLKVTSAHAGRVECTMRVAKDTVNAYGGLHGGCIATIVDHCGTLALLSVKPMKPGVSLEIAVSYLASAKLGEDLRIVSTSLKNGRTIALADVTIRRASDDAIIAIGKHTKHVA
jgi:acyl-coenzyme A thioesterase 13